MVLQKINSPKLGTLLQPPTSHFFQGTVDAAGSSPQHAQRCMDTVWGWDLIIFEVGSNPSMILQRKCLQPWQSRTAPCGAGLCLLYTHSFPLTDRYLHREAYIFLVLGGYVWLIGNRLLAIPVTQVFKVLLTWTASSALGACLQEQPRTEEKKFFNRQH